MKKIVVMGVLLGLLLVLSCSAQAATGGRFFFGAFAEMGQYLSYQGIGFGGEVGYAVSNLIRVVAEGAVGHLADHFRIVGEYSQNFAKDRIVEDRVPGFSEQEVFFGSSNIRFGIRIVL